MDFKGHFQTRNSQRCYPLTACDDHSRYNVILEACEDMRLETVKAHLTSAFNRHGLPDAILCDNGTPWSSNWTSSYSRLEIWLLLLGVKTIHGRPYHPQTQGKEERFHRTFKTELLGRMKGFRDLIEVTQELKKWRQCYNWIRPHEALDLDVPGNRFQGSPRTMPNKLPDSRDWYEAGEECRKVQRNGLAEYKGWRLWIGEAFCGHHVAIRKKTANTIEVWFASMKVALFDLDVPKPTDSSALKPYAKKIRDIELEK